MQQLKLKHMAALLKKGNLKSSSNTNCCSEKEWNPVMKPDLNLIKVSADFVTANRISVYKFLIP